MDMSLNKLWEIGKDRKAWYAATHGVKKSRIQRSEWTTATTDVSQRPKVQVVTEHKLLGNIKNVTKIPHRNF